MVCEPEPAAERAVEFGGTVGSMAGVLRRLGVGRLDGASACLQREQGEGR